MCFGFTLHGRAMGGKLGEQQTEQTPIGSLGSF